MSVAEVLPKPIFGPITLEDMRGNELLTRTVLPLVRDVCKHTKGRFTVESVAQGLASGAYGLWGGMRPPANLEAVTVTAVAGEVFDILIVGPAFEEVFPFLPMLAGSARAAKCKRMRLTGPGFWRKHLPMGESNWKVAAMVYERELI